MAGRRPRIPPTGTPPNPNRVGHRRTSEATGQAIKNFGFRARISNPKAFAKSGGRGGINQRRDIVKNTNLQGKTTSGRTPRTINGTRTSGSFNSPPQQPFPRIRSDTATGRKNQPPPKRPTNPHDPRSKDPFMRAGMGLGTNDTKIFGRAGMSMDLKKMRKMF